MRQRAGWTILIASCFIWTALPVIPFLSISSDSKIFWGSGLFIAGEITWYMGLVLLGPEAAAYLKALWRRLKPSSDTANTNDD